MSGAKVFSLEALERFAQDLQLVRQSLLKELDGLELETRRLTGWIDNDADAYWRGQLQLSQRRLSEYSQQLSRCLASVRPNEQRPCTEEKKRVAREKERLQLCEQKIKQGQAASLRWQQHLLKVHTKLHRCRDLAEAELLVAHDRLKSHIERLINYTQLRSGASAISTNRSAATSDTMPVANDASHLEGSMLSAAPLEEHPTEQSSDRTSSLPTPQSGEAL
ncbi:MAG: hypothetical protein KF752_07710 [Pirellulaceae bacterium]|nr:hypothetical protein [Pirellulaceae bacterium]